MKANDKMQINIMNQNKNSPNPLFNVQNSRGEGDISKLNDKNLEEKVMKRIAWLDLPNITCPTKVTNQMT